VPRNECGWQSTLSTVFILLKICADVSGWMKTSAVTHGHDENLHVDNFMVRNPCLDLMSLTKDRLQLRGPSLEQSLHNARLADK
jgi:hypothetical protein